MARVKRRFDKSQAGVRAQGRRDLVCMGLILRTAADSKGFRVSSGVLQELTRGRKALSSRV
jgi:hypothetical protein